jgi:hypothetical protein
MKAAAFAGIWKNMETISVNIGLRGGAKSGFTAGEFRSCCRPREGGDPVSDALSYCS